MAKQWEQLSQMKNKEIPKKELREIAVFVTSYARVELLKIEE